MPSLVWMLALGLRTLGVHKLLHKVGFTIGVEFNTQNRKVSPPDSNELLRHPALYDMARASDATVTASGVVRVAE